MELYEFQKRVFDQLRNGRSVILQAPTGAGKTIAALYPFLYHLAERESKLFPRKCIYSVPVRVLVGHFEKEYQKIVENYNRRYGLGLKRGITVQTGERPEDRRVEGTLVFTTIDQTLSNFLCIPYALSSRLANLNAGAVASSYLVFDEFHLYDPKAAFPTTLQMLHMLRGVVPFTLMTATFSETMLKMLADWLDAEAETVPPNELDKIPSQRGKIRRFHVVDAGLTAEAVLEHHVNRSIAICNTVERAMQLCRDLVNEGCKPLPGAGCADFEEIYKIIQEQLDWEKMPWVVLLHARFLQEHRGLKEGFVRQEFGPPKKYEHRIPSLILVATQVIEVGLDITCETMHTEIAPANSILQRAGRCARFEGEQGDVYIYRVPTKDGKPQYAPYLEEGQSELCDLTWDAFAKPERVGRALNFADEQQLIEEVHGKHDTKLLEKIQSGQYKRRRMMYQALAEQQRGLARELIREVDSRAVIVHPNPQSIEDLWAYEAFSLHRSSLFGAFHRLQKLAEEVGHKDWLIKAPVELPDVEQDSREKSKYKWITVTNEDDLKGAPLVAIHPALVAYDPDFGFRLGEGGEFVSPRRRKGEKEARQRELSYQRETFLEHVQGVYQAYHAGLAGELACAVTRAEQVFGLPPGSVEEAIRLCILFHDLGKLTKGWQDWAHLWQEAIGDPRPVEEMLAHVEYNPHDPSHQVVRELVRKRRPPHAVEGARAVAELLPGVWDLRSPTGELLARATLTAIARHHATSASTYRDYKLHPEAIRTLEEALALMGKRCTLRLELKGWLKPERGGDLRELLIRRRKDKETVLYFLLARALRLSDQRSQEGR